MHLTQVATTYCGLGHRPGDQDSGCPFRQGTAERAL